MENQQKNIDELKKRLAGAEKKYHLKNAVSGISVSLSLLFLLFLFFSLLESVFNFGVPVRTIIIILLTVSVLFSIIKYFLVNLIKSFFIINEPDYENTSKLVGRQFPKIKDELKNSLQLLKDSDDSGSKDLVFAAFKRINEISAKSDFSKIVNYGPVKKNLYRLAFISFIFAFFNLLIPQVSSAGVRILNYNTDYKIPAKFTLTVLPGNKEAVKNQQVKITVKVTGDLPEQLFLNQKFEEDSEFRKTVLKKDTSDVYEYKINSLRSSMEYFAEAENITSETYKITVTDRPVVNNFNINIIPPKYSGLPVEVQKDNGNITALKGSRIEFSLLSSKMLSAAEILFSDSSGQKMTIDNKTAFSNYTISKSANYFFKIKDTAGYENSNPIRYNIDILQDEFPSVAITRPGKDVDLTIDDLVSLSININDDYGFSKLVLNYRLAYSPTRSAEDSYKKTDIDFDKTGNSREIFYNWNMYPLNLGANEMEEYFVEVFDNDVVSGPKASRSEIFKVRVPSLDEIFYAAEQKQNSAGEILEKTLDKAEYLQNEIEKISREMKRDEQEISWDEKEKVEKAMEKFTQLKQEVEKAKNDLSEAAKKLEDNKLLSDETLEKYNEMQKLLDEIQSDELKAALQKLQEQLQQMMRQNVQQSVENLKNNEEYFKKSLERTIELLKRVQVEQKVDELAKRAEEISKNLEDLQKQTEEQKNSPDAGQNKNLQQKQNELSQKLDNLKREMESLQNKMDEIKNMPSDKLGEMREEFSDQKNSEMSEQAKQDISRQDYPKALQQQQKLSKNMSNFQQQMKELQEQMQQKNQIENFMSMMNITNDMLKLSKDQEKLKNETEKMSNSSQQDAENTKQQSDLSSDISKIIGQMSDLSKKTFAITPEMAQLLGKARNEMNSALNNMSNMNNYNASKSQQNAMAYLNQAASMMKNMMNQMMNGEGQGGGMMSMMQQLRQMSQQQMQLNEMTKMMNQGKMSQQQLAQLKRLSEQQAGLKKSLEQLNKEAKESGQSKQMSSNLDKILEEMQEVINGMNTQKVDDKLVQAQERILSKLLDTQRSINERDFEKNRESQSGKQFTMKSPGQLNLSDEETKSRLRDEIRKALNEGYSRDYEELIKQYFELLETTKDSN